MEEFDGLRPPISVGMLPVKEVASKAIDVRNARCASSVGSTPERYWLAMLILVSWVRSPSSVGKVPFIPKRRSVKLIAVPLKDPSQSDPS